MLTPRVSIVYRCLLIQLLAVLDVDTLGGALAVHLTSLEVVGVVAVVV